MAGALAALLALHGAHWAALQSFAWGRMLVQYSQTGSILSAITRTFDGQHPCPLCHKVQAGVASDQKDDGDKSAPEKPRPVEAIWQFRITHTPLPPLAPHEDHFFSSLPPLQLTEAPPVPPPRFFAA